MNRHRAGKPTFFKSSQKRRRGTVLILTVLTLFVLFSFLAFSIDVGFLAGARAEMRRSADAASMAGSWEMYNQLRQGTSTITAQDAARRTAAEYARVNAVTNASLEADSGPLSQEIRTGYLASLDSTSQLSANPDLRSWQSKFPSPRTQIEMAKYRCSLAKSLAALVSRCRAQPRA